MSKHATDEDRADLQTLLDEQDIVGVLARYCRGIDRCDRDQLESCFWPDATVLHGEIDGPASEMIATAMAELPARAAEHGQVTTHLLGNVLIDVRDDTAEVETYFAAAHVEPRPERSQRVFEFHGRYLDRFERRDGVWRIAHRRVVHDWSEARRTLPLKSAGGDGTGGMHPSRPRRRLDQLGPALRETRAWNVPAGWPEPLPRSGRCR